MPAVLAQVLDALLADRAARDRLREAGWRQSGRFQWQDSAERACAARGPKAHRASEAAGVLRRTRRSPRIKYRRGRRELLGEPTGVGRFLREIPENLVRPARAAASVHGVFVPGPASEAPDVGDGRVTVVRDPYGRAGTWRDQMRPPMPAAQLASTSRRRPVTRRRCGCPAPSVVVVHDLSFAHPVVSMARRTSAAMADEDICKARADRRHRSESSAGEITRWTGVSRDRIRIVRHGSPAVGDRGLSGQAIRCCSPIAFNGRHLPEMAASFARVSGALRTRGSCSSATIARCLDRIRRRSPPRRASAIASSGASSLG